MELGRHPQGDPAGGRSRTRLVAAAVAALVGLSAAALADRSGSVEAQDPFVPAEIVSYEPSGALLPSDASDLAISALGNVVSWEYFDVQIDDAASLMRVRTDNATVTPNPRVSEHHGISDDGCVMAYQGPDLEGNEFRPSAAYRFNRCTGGTSTFLGYEYGRWILGRAAVDADGSVIAFPVFDGVEVFTMSGNSLAGARTVPPPVVGWAVSEVAISDDGRTAAVISGPDSDGDGILDTSSLYTLDVPSEQYRGITRLAHRISISGDGSLVTYRNYESGQMAVLDLSVGQIRPLGPFTGASISRDGRYMALRLSPTDSSFIFVARSDDRWVSIAATELASYPMVANTRGFVTASDGVISEHGRWVGWISPNPYLFVDQPPAVTQYTQRQAFVRERRPVITVQSIEYGTVPSATDRTSVVTNVGPSGWRITSIETTGEFQVRAENCPDVLQPGASCQVTVRYLAQTVGQATGELRVRDNSYPGIPLVASGRLIGTFDPGSPPVVVVDPTTTTTIGSTPDPDSGMSITPNPVVFAASVVGQPAPTREATVTNTGDVAVTVTNVGVVGVAAADYRVVDDGCTDESLPPGGTCVLELGFTPTAAGARSATVSASGTSSTFAAAALRGSGRYDAVLEVLPEVAFGGQVVTVTGTGYPASSTVQVSVAGSAPQSATTDGAGRFQLLWLVLDGSPQGTVQIDDVATTEYDAEEVDLQIVLSPMRPQGNLATLDRAIRNHVSR